MLSTEQDELMKEFNEVYGMRNVMSEGFVSSVFSNGIIDEYTPEQLKNFFSNPQKYKEELSTIAEYYYTTNGDVFQQFDLMKILPSLNYKVQSVEKNINYENHVLLINATMKNVNHKELTRDLITQLITTGTVVGVWLGDKKNPYLYVFDDLEHVFPAYRKNGKWTVWVDLAWFDNMGEVNRENEFDNLYPYVVKEDYERYKKNPEEAKYVELPIERSVVLRTHTLKRNQRFGTTWVAQGMYDIVHKKKLKDLEKAVANKIINSIAVLTVGNKEYPNLDIGKTLKRKIFGGVKDALEKNTQEGVRCVAVPEFASLKFEEPRAEPLDPKKFDSIDSDISNATGTSRTLTSGVGGNFASGKLNYEVIYKRISVILDEIEEEVYQKMLGMVLPKTISPKYSIVYDKKPPLSQKEQIEILMKLHSEGFGVKPIIDMLDGVDFDDYIQQSKYEIEVMELNKVIQPYLTAYTMSNKDRKSSVSDSSISDSENTNKSQSSDNNNTPKPT